VSLSLAVFSRGFSVYFIVFAGGFSFQLAYGTITELISKLSHKL